jgi:hypothetical protein
LNLTREQGHKAYVFEFFALKIFPQPSDQLQLLCVLAPHWNDQASSIFELE